MTNCSLQNYPGFSETRIKNFNLYIKSKLVATTNEELYKSDLLDSRLDEEAYYNIVHQRRELFIKTQDIGTLSYLVGYEPYYDASGKMAGIVSSQLVYKQNEINEELTKTLTFYSWYLYFDNNRSAYSG